MKSFRSKYRYLSRHYLLKTLQKKTKCQKIRKFTNAFIHCVRFPVEPEEGGNLYMNTLQFSILPYIA